MAIIVVGGLGSVPGTAIAAMVLGIAIHKRLERLVLEERGLDEVVRALAAAIGGTALALDSTIYPSLHWRWIGPLMAIIVVGGLGSVPGTAIAAMVLGMAMSLLQIPLGTTWAQTVFYLALFATLAVRPQGFFGGRLAKRF
jgi:branched-subunit amino acid ABC-type transport system permease component